VQPVVQHLLLELDGPADEDAKARVRRRRREAGDGPGYPHVLVRHAVVDDPDAQFARRAALRLGNLRTEVLERGEQLARGEDDSVSFARKAKHAAPALAQAAAESRLELRHPGTDRGLAEVQLRLGRGEAAALRDHVEDPQQLDVAV
jgi:hypothetical protein